MSFLTGVSKGVWRPSLPISIDGQPLTVSTSDLLGTFPYNRLPSNMCISLFMRREVVLLSVLVYIWSEPALKYMVLSLGITGKSRGFQAAVATHNLMLALFSFVVAFNSWILVILNLVENGLEATYCDQDGSFWASGFGGWTTIFYLSKYYEFVDTWILILKGKQPSFLQIYHHIGVVIAMWGGVASHSAWLLILVLLNSVIHTAMYTYFFIKTLYPKKEINAARYLTAAQIGQFIVGVTCTMGVFIMGDRCDTPASRVMCAFMDIYVLGLIMLFKAFATKKYKKK